MTREQGGKSRVFFKNCHCFRLCGTKLGCGEGGCGACTVMVSRVNREGGKVEHLSINACLAPVASMHGELIVSATMGNQADTHEISSFVESFSIHVPM